MYEMRLLGVGSFSRKGKKWRLQQVFERSDGTKGRVDRLFDTKGDALRFQRSFDGEVNNGMTFGQILESTQRRVWSNKAHRTLQTNSSSIKLNVPKEYYKKPIKHLTAPMWYSLFERLEQEGKSPHVRRKLRSAVNGVYSEAIRMGEVSVSPIKGLVISGETKSKTVIAIEPKAIKTGYELLVSKGKEGHAVLFLLSCVCGLRHSEAIAMTWEQINLEEGYVVIDRMLTYGESYRHEVQSPKADSRRTLPLPSFAVDALKKYKLSRNFESDPLFGSLLFVGRTGKPLRHKAFYGMWRVIKEELKLPSEWRPHSARSSLASTLLLSGKMSEEQIKALIGHTDLRVTRKHYRAITQQFIEDVRSQFEGLFDA